MNQTANDWASPDPSKNMTLAEADRFRDDLAASLGVRFYDRFVRSTSGDIVLEDNLRHNPLLSPRLVNLKGHLSGTGAVEINIAEFRSRLRAAARSADPLTQLRSELMNAMPGANITSLLLCVPGVPQTICNGLDRL